MYKDLELSALPKSISQAQAFEIFWEAGMRKVNKKKSRDSFKRIAKHVDDLLDFALMLDSDVKWRLQNNQFGFSSMHPTTYLNGERWEDEQIIEGQKLAYEKHFMSDTQSTSDMTIADMMDRDWAP